MSLRAVITAGGLVDDAFAEAIGTPVKALAPFGERRLIDIVLDACTEAGIDGIAVIGGDAVRAHLAKRGSNGLRTLDAAADGGTNVMRALDAWPGERFVYLTSDLPFATGPGVRDLVTRSVDSALTMGIASTQRYDERFPNAPPYGVALGGERLVNACGFVIAPDAIAPLRSFATKFFAARKSLLQMALLLGPALCLRFAFKRLTVAQIEAHAQRTLGVPVAAIRDCDPGLCYDVDTLDEYRDACTRLG